MEFCCPARLASPILVRKSVSARYGSSDTALLSLATAARVAAFEPYTVFMYPKKSISG